MSYLKRILNPEDKFGGYFAPHVALTALAIKLVLILIGVLFGAAIVHHFDATYYRQKYQANIPLPRVSAPAPLVRSSAPSAASIDISRYPAVGDQGQIGACAAWATAWDLSFEWRKLHRTSWLRFSPRQEYDYYSDTYNGGKDGGSWPDQDASIASTVGLLQFKALPEPPVLIDNPQPTYDAYGRTVAVDAAKHRFNPAFTQLTGYSMGAGPGALDALRPVIASGHPVLIAFPVYPEYDNATNTNGLIETPHAGETSRGGHENVILAYNDNLRFPDGEVGGVEIQNQWNTWWSVGGRAWMSYGYVEQYSFGLETARIAPLSKPLARATHPIVPFFPSNHHTFRAPRVPTAPHAAASSWYVNTSTPYASSINAAGDAYHVWPVALAAVIGTESNFNPNAERWGTYPDQSCGLMQETISTASSYGVAGDARQVCNWEENPANGVLLGAHILRDYEKICGQPWAQLYLCWNAGPYQPSSFYAYPSGQAYSNFVNFVSWYQLAIARYSGGSGPRPKPQPRPKPIRFSFPYTRYEQYRFRHHQSAIDPWSSHRLTWPASVFDGHQRIGGIKDAGTWNAHKRFDLYRYAHGKAFCWPRYGSCKVVKS